MRITHLLSVTSLFIVFAATSQSVQADIIYRLTNLPGLQNGRTLTGSITTNGDIGDIGSDNRLFESEIVSWTFTISGGSDPGTGGWVDSFTVSSGDSNAFIDLPSGTWATANEIAIADSNLLRFGIDDGAIETTIAYKSAGTDKFYFANYLSNVDPNGWDTRNPSFPTAGGTGAWQIATAIPEPASAGLVVLFSAPALLKRRRRC